MHILDLIMFFPLAAILWWIIDKTSDSEFTEELGVLIGLCIELVFLGTYIIIFGVFDVNWIDMFSGVSIPNIEIKL
jgi:hypothetical protein